MLIYPNICIINIIVVYFFKNRLGLGYNIKKNTSHDLNDLKH